MDLARGPCNIVLVMPDSGVKYLDTVYDDQWLKANDLGGVLEDVRRVRATIHRDTSTRQTGGTT